MAVVPNSAKRLLNEGGIAASFNAHRLRGSELGQLARACGFQWLLLDMEHSALDTTHAADICAAALPTGVTPIVRVPEMDLRLAARVLDSGAQGVIFPHVDTPEQAREIVSAIRFPPRGRRSLTYGGPLLQYENVPPSQALAELDAETLIAVMLETPEAIARADAIAAVEGVDVVMIGAQDLAASMGIPGEIAHPRLKAAFETMVGAARAHGKHAGMGGIYHEPLMEQFIKMGVRFLFGGADINYVLVGARKRAEFIRSVDWKS